jgi:UDP-N-acetylglucosamine transferase subunit ALG13
MPLISFSDIGRQNIFMRLLLRFTQSDFLEGDIEFQYMNLVLFDRQLLISEHGEGIFFNSFFQDTNILIACPTETLSNLMQESDSCLCVKYTNNQYVSVQKQHIFDKPANSYKFRFVVNPS